MFPAEIETERLRFVRLCRSNVRTTDLHRHMRAGNPDASDASEYALWDPHETLSDTRDLLADAEEQWADREQATYAIYPRDDEPRAGELAGTTSLDFDWERHSAELGIWLRKPFWGRGYSGERAAALMELAFEVLGLDRVGAAHQDGNERSRRAIEKYVERFGGQYDRLLRDFAVRDGEVRDLHRYTVSREQYRTANAADRQANADGRRTDGGSRTADGDGE